MSLWVEQLSKFLGVKLRCKRRIFDHSDKLEDGANLRISGRRVVVLIQAISLVRI